MRKVLNGDCTELIKDIQDESISLTYFDPPFNLGKREYVVYNDRLEDNEYWEWIESILTDVYRATKDGGSIYFMQRESNVDRVLQSLRNSGWTFQNLIIWRKKSAPVMQKNRYSKKYQVIAYFTKGKENVTFNTVRIHRDLPENYKVLNYKGFVLTDIWEDIRELSSGFYAGKEAIRDEKGDKIFYGIQSPIALLLRILLVSSFPGDVVLDPFAGLGTSLVVAKQLKRKYIGIELYDRNYEIIKKRLKNIRSEDDILKYYSDYVTTASIESIWPVDIKLNEELFV
jgi:DNA modification methylase